jgi:hypothetical protein
MGQTAFADLDDDGDLDFAAGQRDDLPGGMYWWEHCTADHWVLHKVGAGQQSDSSGDALDVDGDGLIDLLSGDSWFKNPGNSRDTEWVRIVAGTPAAEELTVGDVTGDGKADVLYVNGDIPPQWYEINDNLAQGFSLGGTLDHNIQQGAAWGDLNGDSHEDGNGVSFTEHAIDVTEGFDGTSAANAPLSYIGDLDGDGDNDFALSTHWMGGGDSAKLGWVENLDGLGSEWELHMLSDTGMFAHGVVLADFDNDGDLDILWARNVGPTFIWENEDGLGSFVEQQIVDDFRGHTPRVGDADCDGDLDIAGGPWGDQGPYDHGESEGMPIRDYVYLENQTVDNGGPAIFDDQRKPYELGWRDKDHCLR